MTTPKTSKTSIPMRLMVSLPLTVFCLAITAAAIFFVIIPSAERSAIQQQKHLVRELVQNARGLAESYQQMQRKGLLSPAEAQGLAKAAIAKLSYGPRGKGRIWIRQARPSRKPEPGSYRAAFEPWGWIIGADAQTAALSQAARLSSRHTWLAASILVLVSVILAFVFFGSHRRDKQWRQAIRRQCESEEKFQLAFDHSSLAMGLIDINGNIITVNQAACDLFGLSREEMTGVNYANFALPDDVKKNRENFKRLFHGEIDSYHMQVRCHRPAGGLIWGWMDVSLVRDQTGEPLYTIVQISNLTEHMQTERALAKSESSLRALVDGLADALVVLNTDRIITDCNPAFELAFGYNRQEVLGASIRLIHQDQDNFLRFARDIYPQVLAQGHWRGEWVYQRKNGGQVTMDTAVSANLLPDGSLGGYYVAMRDASERIQAQEALRQSEATLRSIQQAAPVGMGISFYPGRTWTGVNPYLAKMLGYSAAEMEGLDPRRLYASQEEYERIGNIFFGEDQRRGTVSANTVWLTRDGRPLDIFISAASLNPDGRSKDLVFTAMDITERKQSQHEREHLEAQLRQAQKMEAVGTLAGGIAHDFNNILGAITGYTELALDTARRNQSNQDELQLILSATERAKSLVNQILAFSRKSDYQPRPLDLNEQVKTATGMLERTIPKMIKIEMALEPGLSMVMGDAGQIEQVIMNLANNAGDAMPDGGVLKFTSGNLQLTGKDIELDPDLQPGRYVMLRVSDTGVGMDPKTIQYIFDPFYTTKEVGKGTGLGLSTVYGIVVNHNGVIRCSSRPGKGTMFTILLPAIDQKRPTEEPAQPAGKSPAGGSETLLLVDDDAALRDIGKRILSVSGYKVLTASDGEEALAVYADHGEEIDLVILDLGMPGMGGLACLDKLRERDPGVKVLVASGYAAGGQRENLTERGASGFVAKPFKAGELLNKIRSILDAPS